MKWVYEYTFRNVSKGYFERWMKLKLPLTLAVATAYATISGLLLFPIHDYGTVFLGYICILILAWLILGYFAEMLLAKYRMNRHYRMVQSTTVRYELAGGNVITHIARDSYRFSLSDFTVGSVFDGCIYLNRNRTIVRNKTALWFMNNEERDKALKLLRAYYAKHEDTQKDNA